MRKLTLLVCAFTFLLAVNAQVKTPQPSPYTKIEQTIGLTDVTLEYSRPSMKERKIFGNLVPFGKLWRAGANKNTIITFSDAVVVAGKTLKAGSYALFIKPEAKSWDVYFYSDTENWGTPREWDESKVAAKATIKTYQMPIPIETWTISFDELTNNSAAIGFIWENTYAGVKFEVPTDNAVDASIEKALNGPSANDYYAAAVYYSNTDKDLKKAEEWMNKAMSMLEKPRFWQLRQQSLLLAKLGKKEEAIATAKKSLEGAKASGNDDYIKMNMDSLKEWGAL
jgi:tetratricopeptide (TPR) repeat protein